MPCEVVRTRNGANAEAVAEVARSSVEVRMTER